MAIAKSIKNKKKNTSKRHRKTAIKKINGGGKRSRDGAVDEITQRKSARVLGLSPIRPLELTNSENSVKNVITQLKPGLQIINLPTAPQSHSIGVFMQPDETASKHFKIQIIDWGGEDNRYRGDDYHIINKGKDKGKPSDFDYRIYTKFMRGLEAEFDRENVTYFKEDECLLKKAMQYHKDSASTSGADQHGRGGCSKYLTDFIEQNKDLLLKQ